MDLWQLLKLRIFNFNNIFNNQDFVRKLVFRVEVFFFIIGSKITSRLVNLVSSNLDFPGRKMLKQKRKMVKVKVKVVRRKSQSKCAVMLKQRIPVRGLEALIQAARVCLVMKLIHL